jgi:hypothetical protein
MATSSRNSQGLVRSVCTVNGKRESSETEPLGWTPEPGNGAVHVKGTDESSILVGLNGWDLGNCDR